MPALVLACVAYLAAALPGSTIGLLWPSMRISFHQPVGALGLLLAAGVVASVASSAAAGPLLARLRVGTLVAWGAALAGLALAVEALAPSLWVVAAGFVLFGAGFGATDSALNVHAARRFGPRQINWMHASYGLGATVGPLLVTVILAEGIGWRLAYGAMAIVLAGLGIVFAIARRAWLDAAGQAGASPMADDETAGSVRGAGGGASGVGARAAGDGDGAAGDGGRTAAAVAAGLVFTAVETGIESGAGIWGFVFLTAGRGMPAVLAGITVSAYWATMFAGRAALGPIAERLGAPRVLGAAVAGVSAGAALMAVPGPAILAVTGLLALGLAAAPVFPLFTLTTPDRLRCAGGGGITRAVTLQVASSAIGSAALPAAIGLLIGAAGATALGPALLVLGLAMACLYAMVARPGRTAPDRPVSRRSSLGGGRAEAAAPAKAGPKRPGRRRPIARVAVQQNPRGGTFHSQAPACARHLPRFPVTYCGL